MRFIRWWVSVAVLSGLAAPVQARRSSFVRDIVVVASNTSAPVGDEKWRQVPERRKLGKIIQHPTPGWWNLWLPVRFDEVYLMADTLNIAEFYRDSGYLDASIESASFEPVETETDMQFVDVVIVVAGIGEDDRYSLTGIRFNGVRSLDSTKIAAEFSERHGKEGYFSPAAADENLVRLKTAYADAGYLDSTAVSVVQHVGIDRKDHTVIERYDVTERSPVRVGGFRIVNGNAPDPLKTDSTVIVASLLDARLRPEAAFGRQYILNAEANLADLGVFRRARVTPEIVPGTGDSSSHRRAVVDLAERDSWDIRTRAGWSNIEQWRVSGRGAYNNLLGQAKTLGSECQASVNRLTVSLFYSQPRIGVPRRIPGVGGTSLRLRMDHVLTAEWEVTDATLRERTRTLQWKVAVSRRFGPLARLGIAYDFARKDYSLKRPFGVGGRVAYPGTVTLSGTYDSRDDYLNPTRGTAITSQVQLTNTLGGPRDVNVRPEWLAQHYRRISSRLVAAISYGGGFYYIAQRGTYDPLSQFWRSDQTPTVRGYLRDDLTVGIPRDSAAIPEYSVYASEDLTIVPGIGGMPAYVYDSTGVIPPMQKAQRSAPAMAYLLAKIEVRADVWRKLGFVVFADFGHAWSPARDRREYMLQTQGWSAMRSGRFAASAGFGPRLNWTLPIRVDFARKLRPPTEWKLEFGIGQAF